jgi:hypothetical protein
MWARFVVKQVRDLERKGEGLRRIEAAIRSIPSELDELHNGLIQGMKPASLKLIQWLCFATRSLSLDELRWAMVVNADGLHVSLPSCQSADNYISDAGIMRRQVQTLSRGLAQVTVSSDEERDMPSINSVARAGTQVVQFIHQSVKYFFVKKGLYTLYRGYLTQSQWHTFSCQEVAYAIWRWSKPVYLLATFFFRTLVILSSCDTPWPHG